jgi:hypothetical protein
MAKLNMVANVTPRICDTSNEKHLWASKQKAKVSMESTLDTMTILIKTLPIMTLLITLINATLLIT